MSEIRHLLLQSQGIPLSDFINSGLVDERVRSALGETATGVSVHRDTAAHLGVARTGAHACSLGKKVFIGPAVGTPAGPTLLEALNHELVHVAQVAVADATGQVSSRVRIESEAIRFVRSHGAPVEISEGASRDEVYTFWWLIPLAAAAYVILRPNVANAPAPGDRTYPSVSEAQVAGEALALFAVPNASFAVAGRLGLGFYGSMAVAGASSTMSFRAVGDVAAGEFSGVQTYVIDGATGAIIGVVVPGGIRLAGSGARRSLDWLATQGMRQSDFAITRVIAQRAATSPVTAEELSTLFQNRNLTGRAADWWLQRRGLIVLYRGQAAPTARILSPLARAESVEASELLVGRMRAAGLPDSEIAGYTARWHTQPPPDFLVPPELAGQPVGAAGIPTTRIPGIAADFGGEGVVYLIRLPRSAAIQVPQWGLAVENEYVILNQVGRDAVIEAIPASRIPALTVNETGQLVLGVRSAGAAGFSAADALPALTNPRLPVFGAPPLFTPWDPRDTNANAGGAARSSVPSGSAGASVVTPRPYTGTTQAAFQFRYVDGLPRQPVQNRTYDIRIDDQIGATRYQAVIPYKVAQLVNGTANLVSTNTTPLNIAPEGQPAHVIGNGNRFSARP